jgi:parvulin-like peptidyl-prolyl isomerase
MKLSRRANTIILWLVSIGLLAGMVITFTPTLGLGTGGANVLGRVALVVNGEELREFDNRVAALRTNPLFLSVTTGEVGGDLQLLLVDELIRQEVVRQESVRQRVTDADVRRAVDEFRTSRGLSGRANDSAYLDLLARSGFSDQTFRAYLREQLQTERWEASVVAGVEATDAEVAAFFEINRNRYLSEERILARHLVFADAEAAALALARLDAGEAAGLVAREVSLERADRDGALGAAAGETAPRPVGRAALPLAVSNAAFALVGAGTTPVIEADGRFHIVVVEGYLRAEPRPFEEVANAVRDDATDIKRAGVLEGVIDRLAAAARVEVPASGPLTYNESVVARVGETEIRASELARTLYTNPQIQQVLSPENAFIVTAFFKPSVLEQLVDQAVAMRGVADLGVPLMGPRAYVAQSALAYVTRGVEVSQEDIDRYYRENTTLFTTPPSALLYQASSESLERVADMRARLLEGAGVFEDAAVAAGVALTNFGVVTRGRFTGLIDLALFGTEAFTPLPTAPWAVSDILVLQEEAAAALPESIEVEPEPTAPEAGASVYVLLIADRRAERVRPVTEVRAQIEATLRNEREVALRDSWLAQWREGVAIEFVGGASGEGFGFEIDAPATDEPAGGN